MRKNLKLFVQLSNSEIDGEVSQIFDFGAYHGIVDDKKSENDRPSQVALITDQNGDIRVLKGNLERGKLVFEDYITYSKEAADQ